MTTIRPATSADVPFLVQMLAVAADWRPDAVVRAPEEVLRDPALAHYVAGFGEDDRDVGLLAEEDGVAVGAAWWRFLPAEDPGYGFVDEATPELAVGVAAEARGRGVGTALLAALIQEARGRGLPALSLSVEADNPALAIYRRLGFEVVGADDGSPTMLLDLAADRGDAPSGT